MADLKIGDKVRLLQDCCEEADGDHPHLCYGKNGDTVVVRKIGDGGQLGVAHEHRTDGRYFYIFASEYEAVQ